MNVKIIFFAVCLIIMGHTVLLATPYNIAPEAHIMASSALKSCEPDKIADGIIGVNGKGEWVSDSKVTFWGEINYPWIQLEWDQPVTVNRIVLYDRSAKGIHTAEGYLLFDDGSRVYAGAIPDDGAPRQIKFTARKTKKIRFVITDGDGSNLGLSEIEVFPSPANYTDYVSYVDPYIETTRGRYFFFVTGSLPYGMMSAAPLTRNKNQDGGGYNYNDTRILGFPQIHGWMLSGLDLMPVTGSQYGLTEQEWQSAFSHESEIVQPAYHRLFLERYHTWVEQTCTQRTSLYRITYTQEADATLLLNLGGYLSTTTMINAHITKAGNSEIRGYFDTAGRLWGGPDNIRVYFVAQVNTPADNVDAYSEGRIMNNALELKGAQQAKARNEGMSYADAPTCGVRLHFKHCKPAQQLLVRMSFSYTSETNAVNNLQAEGSWDFDAIRARAQQIWNNYLGRIEVKGGQDSDKIKLYTDLWHVLLGRHTIDDASGDYPDYTQGIRDGKYTHNARLIVRHIPDRKYHMFNSDALWLTQWNLNTLWGLAWPEIIDNMAASLLQYARNGKLLPRGPNCGGYSYIMSGSPATSLISSAFQQGIAHLWSPSEALPILVRNHEKGGMLAIGQDEDLEFYKEHGYCPDRAGLTIQWSFEDWALGQMALSMNKKNIADTFLRRSEGWKQSFNPQLKLIMPRRKDGSWLHLDPLNGWGFEESNSWQATFGLSNDLKGLAQLMGGNDSLCARLNKAFELSVPSDFIDGYGNGYVSYANQPGLSNAHVFAHCGHPELTQYWVKRVRKQAYGGITPGLGYGGHDEDQGQMGAMSALMSIGLFSIDGFSNSKPMIDITTPVFDEVVIHLDTNYYPGKMVRIITHNNAPNHYYIDKATWNGNALRGFQLPHKNFTQGGTLELWLH